MKKTVLIRIDGCDKSWTTANELQTCDMPTKDGVLRHFIAAAQGRDASADISDLMRDITFGVAIVQAGYLVDCAMFPDNDDEESFVDVSTITDGIFYAGLYCEADLAKELLDQLRHPQNTMSYGISKYPVEKPLTVLLSSEPLVQALEKAAFSDPARRIRMEVEGEETPESSCIAPSAE